MNVLRAHTLMTAVAVLLALPVRAYAVTADEQNTIGIFERVSPSVVSIKNASLQWDWFSANVYEVPTGAGSGFVWDKDGHIVTNFHVIYQANKIEVTLTDQKAYTAKVIGVSPDHDLAVIKIEAPPEELFPIVPGASKDVQVGQKAVSIGNPFGLDYSLTTGVVSALGRNIRALSGSRIYDVIQTDAAINPGNSGGPLLNSDGELIGISTAIYSPSGASAGIGFAIPASVVKRVVPQLIAYGRVKRIGLGVIMVADKIRERLGESGALIMQVQNGGAADQAGLRPTRRNVGGRIILGDIIVKIDQTPIKNNEDLLRALESKQEGQRVDVTFIRDGREFGTTVVLQELQ